MQSIEACIDLLREAYGAAREDIRVVLSPYRICPLGAHVDHQLGRVSGMPIDRGIALAFAPGGRRGVRLRSLDFRGEVAFSLDDVPAKAEGDWGNYPRGALRALRQTHGLRRGLDGVIAGSLPIGGLSSSAAAGVAYLMALGAVNGLSLSPDDLIALDRHIENVYLGLNNGVLDQSVIVAGRKGKLLHVDCLSNERRALDAPEGMPAFEALIVHSGVTQALVTTGYNRRVAECEEAARGLLEMAGGPVPAPPRLRHVSRAAFEAHGERLPDSLRRRARHFFEENDRVAEGARAWTAGDLARFGALMNASGRSSIDHYECGSPPLIALYEILRDLEGVYGTRFSGAGFRGACVALIDPMRRTEVEAEVRRSYAGRFPEYRGRFSIQACGTDDGARMVE
ncbi:galactokinase [bacterium]|nr:galactokinase [bacterium]